MSDWNDKIGGVDFALSTTHYEGIKSLRLMLSAGDARKIKILTQTEADNPKSVNVDFWHNMGNNMQYSLFFRYQDLDNYYMFTFGEIPGDLTNIRCRLGVRETGGDSWSAITDTGYASTGGAWRHWKIKFCEIGGTIYANLFRGNGSRDLCAELTQSPAKFTSGGAFGVGAHPVNCPACGGRNVYLDSTYIYY